MTAIHRMEAAIGDAVVELDAAHRMDGTTRPLCVTCGAAGGSWPCLSRMVADDLRSVLDSGRSTDA